MTSDERRGNLEREIAGPPERWSVKMAVDLHRPVKVPGMKREY